MSISSKYPAERFNEDVKRLQAHVRPLTQEIRKDRTAAIQYLEQKQDEGLQSEEEAQYLQNVMAIQRGARDASTNWLEPAITRSTITSQRAEQDDIGRRVHELVSGLWHVGFSAYRDGSSYLAYAGAKKDTSAGTSVIRRDVLERCGMLDQTKLVDDPQRVLVDASEQRHPLRHYITLNWFIPNVRRTPELTDFFIIESGPFEMMIGDEFIREALHKLSPGSSTVIENELSVVNESLLPLVFKTMNEGEKD